MGVLLHFESESSYLSVPFPPDIVEALDKYEDIFDKSIVTRVDEESVKYISKDKLMDNIALLIDQIKADKPEYTYCINIVNSITKEKLLLNYTSGGISGLKFEGKSAAIFGGLNKCDLIIHHGRDAYGNIIEEHIDIRRHATYPLDDGCFCKIKKRKLVTKSVKWLVKLREALSAIQEGTLLFDIA